MKKSIVFILMIGLTSAAYGGAPTSGLVAQWDAADTVFDGGGQLTGWPDATGHGHDLYPKYGTAGFDFRAYTQAFPTGVKPTVEFFGLGGLGMDDAVEDDFDLQNLSIFFVHGDRGSDGGIETGWLVWNFASGGYGTTIDAGGIVPYAFNENQAPHPAYAST